MITAVRSIRASCLASMRDFETAERIMQIERSFGITDPVSRSTDQRLLRCMPSLCWVKSRDPAE